MSASRIVRPSAEYKESFLTALSEYHNEENYLYQDRLKTKTHFKDFIKTLNTEKGQPHQPYPEWVDPVPETITWLVKDENYIGTAEIRHRLNWHLEKWGGHINFIIRPSMRNLGFGKKLLIKTMPIANYLGIDNALVTVHPQNKPAIRIVESCGGVLQDELPQTDQFPPRLRYILDCT